MRAAITQQKVTAWLKHDVFPCIGKQPFSSIKAINVLAALRKIEARGAIDSAHRVKSLCGQVLRFAVATGIAERDVTADLKGALTTIQKTNDAAITEPKQAGDLMRSIYTYSGYP